MTIAFLFPNMYLPFRLCFQTSCSYSLLLCRGETRDRHLYLDDSFSSATSLLIQRASTARVRTVHPTIGRISCPSWAENNALEQREEEENKTKRGTQWSVRQSRKAGAAKDTPARRAHDIGN